MSGRRFSVEAVFNASGNFGRRVQKMSRGVGRFNSQLGANLSRVKKFQSGWNEAAAPVKRFGQTTARVGIGAGVAAGVALKSIVAEGADVEKTLAVMSAKFGDNAKVGSKAYADLKKAAMEVGQETEMSAAQAAGALKFMAMAGEAPAVAMDVLGDAANFATAGETELARATDIMSDAMGPMIGQLEEGESRADAYRRTMDLMTHATTRGNMGLEEMFEATKMGAATFRNSGQDIEQFTASVAVLSNAGIKGSKAGKDLARIMASLMDPSKKAAKEMRKIGFKPLNKDGTIKDFDVLMRELQQKTAKMDEGKRAKFLLQVLGKNSAASAQAIMANVDQVTKLAEEARHATGITAKQAKDIRNTTEGMMKGLSSAASAVKLEIFEVIKDDVQDIVKATTAWAKENKGLIAAKFKAALTWLRDNFKDIVKWGKRIGTLVAVFMAVDLAIKGVVLTMTAARGAQFIFGKGMDAAGFAAKGFGGIIKGVGAQVMAARGDLGLLAKQVNTFQGPLGKLGAVAGIAGAAFIGWEIGKLINEFTGADKALAAFLIKSDKFMAFIDGMNKRTATKSQDEFLNRQKEDLAKMREEYKGRTGRQIMDFVGLEGQNFGADAERVRMIEAQEKLVARLEAKKALRSQGLDPNDARTMAAKAKVDEAQAAFDKSRGLEIVGGSGAGWFEGEDSRLAELNRAKAELDTFVDPLSARGLELAGPMLGPEAPGEAPNFAPDAPAPAPGPADKAAQDAATAQGMFMQMLEELRKGNARTDKTELTVNAPAGATVDGEPAQGTVTVERTGTNP